MKMTEATDESQELDDDRYQALYDSNPEPPEDQPPPLLDDHDAIAALNREADYVLDQIDQDFGDDLEGAAAMRDAYIESKWPNQSLHMMNASLHFPPERLCLANMSPYVRSKIVIALPIIFMIN